MIRGVTRLPHVNSPTWGAHLHVNRPQHSCSTISRFYGGVKQSRNSNKGTGEVGLSASTVITKETRIQTIEFPWAFIVWLYCLFCCTCSMTRYLQKETKKCSVFTHVARIEANLLEKRKRLHKKRVQVPQDWFGTPTWPPSYCFGTPI